MYAQGRNLHQGIFCVKGLDAGLFIVRSLYKLAYGRHLGTINSANSFEVLQELICRGVFYPWQLVLSFSVSILSITLKVEFIFRISDSKQSFTLIIYTKDQSWMVISYKAFRIRREKSTLICEFVLCIRNALYMIITRTVFCITRLCVKIKLSINASEIFCPNKLYQNTEHPLDRRFPFFGKKSYNNIYFCKFFSF